MNIKKVYKLGLILSVLTSINLFAGTLDECENNKLEWAMKADNVSNHLKSEIDSLDYKNSNFLKEVAKIEDKIARTKLEIEKSETIVDELRHEDDSKYTENEKEKNKKEIDKNENNIEEMQKQQDDLNEKLKSMNEENKEKYLDKKQVFLDKLENRINELGPISENGKCSENSLGEAFYTLYK